MASSCYILSVGAWKKRKGYETSIAAFRLLKNDMPDLRYVVVSNAPDQEGIEVKRNVSHDELDALYAHAEIFVLAPCEVDGDVEGFGLVFLEAAKAGLPIVATRSGGVEDAVLEGKNAFLCPPGDVSCLSAAMHRILRDPALRGRMSEASRAFAGRMSWEVQIPKYVHLYETL